MDIIKIIRENKLIYFKFPDLANQLAKLTGENVDELNGQIRSLINDGSLFVDDSNRVFVSADKGYYKSKLILNKKGYGFAQVEGMPDFFIPAFAINGAFDGDDCMVEIVDHVGEEIEGRIVKVLKRNTTHVVGTYIEGKSKNVVFPDDERLPQIRIFKNDSGKAKNNDKVWVEINLDSIEEKVMRGKVIEVLGQANTPKAEQISIIRSYGLVDDFEPEVLASLSSINQEVNPKNFKKREDFTEQRVITIDGEDARDFDDAIAVDKLENGGYRLFVHIADVSNYVVENSPLDKSAYKRGTSVYFPNMVIPMLPKEISNGICSLKEGEFRLVLTVVIELDKNCKVLNSRVTEGIIKNNHRMTYTEVENILAGDELLIEKFKDVYDDILTYQKISTELKKQRKVRGEIRMNIPEPFILENSSGEIISIENRVQDESHEIIESLMVLTNECVAKTYFDLALPFVYRVHEKPDEEKVKRLAQILKNMGVANNLEKECDKPVYFQQVVEKITGTPKERTLTKMVLRSMMKAKYAPTCLGHFGIASEFYCHFTSPIRRYPDLMIHRIIKNYLNGVPVTDLKMKYAPIVLRASEQSSETERNADECEREVEDYKKAVYMTKFLGEEFEGTISGVQEFGIFVELDNGVEGLVRIEDLPYDEYQYDDMNLTLYGSSHHYTIGDKVKIVVANTNVKLRQIDFDLVGVEKGGSVLLKENKKKSQQSKTSEKAKGKAQKGKRKKR